MRTPDELHLMKMLTDLFENGKISITTDIEHIYAEKGDGQWNSITTSVIIDGKEVCRKEGRYEALHTNCNCRC